MRVAFLF
jgi:hypothetical protein